MLSVFRPCIAPLAMVWIMVEYSNKVQVTEAILKWENQDSPLAPLSENDAETVKLLSEYSATRPLPKNVSK